jgi:xanthine dehydrogenase accessory factor
MSVDVIRAAAESAAGAVLVTVIGTQGSVPRHAGSKMLVRRDKQIVGTVGGGKGEAMALEAASRCIAERSSRTIAVEMQGVEATGPNMVCGGTGTMLLEYISDGQAYRAARGALDAGRRTVMVKKLEGMAGGAAGTVSVAVLEESGPPPNGLGYDPRSAALCMATGKPLFSEEKGVFYDPVLPQEKLIILGGGHVGQALADMAAGLDFEVTVVDDRPEFAVPGRFHSSVKTICSGYAEAIASFPFDSATYAVIVTRGHLFDLECIRGVLARNYRYAGFIGSARKAKLLKAQATSDGFEKSRVAGLRAPIGLDIAAETPAEIAVSILGEIVAVRRNAGDADAGPTAEERTPQIGA